MAIKILNRFKRIIEKPWWSFASFALACFMFFGLSDADLWKFLMDFEWVINATKWSLIGGAFIFSLSAYSKAKRRVSRIDLNKFKTSFTDITFDLRDAKPEVIYQIPEFLEQHEKAKIKLELSLDPKEAKRLNKIWKQYRNNTGEYYSRFGGLDSPTSENWPKMFLKEVEDMISKVNELT